MYIVEDICISMKANISFTTGICPSGRHAIEKKKALVYNPPSVAEF